jgi:hypothetical protein
MSNNLYQQSIEILQKATRTSNEAERNKLLDRANEIFRNPDFIKYHPNNSNSNSENSENSETSESNESDKQNIKINNNNSMLEFINNDDEDKQPDIIIDDITVKKSNREKINNIMEKMNLNNNNNNKLDQSIQSIQSIKPIINSKLMVSDEYKQKRSLILSIRSYLDLFFESKEGLRILLNMKDKKDLVLFNSK